MFGEGEERVSCLLSWISSCRKCLSPTGMGAGLTLQRVLGADLDHVRLFAHVSRRLATDFPAVARISSRSLEDPMWAESERVYKVIGHTFAGWLSKGRRFSE